MKGEILILLLFLHIATSIDYQKQVEYEHALDYIIQLVREGRLAEFKDEGLRRCTEIKCCLCGLEFKNASYSALHMAIHHHQVFNHTQEIRILFDDKVPKQERYSFCLQYLAPMELSHSHHEEVCIVLSEDFYKPKVGVTVAKYILIVGVTLLCLIYYGDIIHK